MKIDNLFEHGATDEIEWRNTIRSNRSGWEKITKGWFIVDKTGKKLHGPFPTSADATRFRNNRTDLPTPNFIREF